MGIENPQGYVDRSNTALARSYPQSESILIGSDVYEKLNEGELQALVAHEIKHLYQGYPKIPIFSAHEKEYDADRAAIDSSSLDAALSSFRKIDRIAVERITSSRKATILTLLKANPELRFVGDLKDRVKAFLTHPSPVHREKAMSDYWQTKVTTENDDTKLINHNK